MRKFKTIIVVIICCIFCIVNSLAESQAPPEAKKTQVVILGTIHTAHYKSRKYSPEILKEIILSLKPGAILIERPLSQVDPNGRPLERFRGVTDEAAMELGIRQIPFDQPDREEYYRKTNYLKRNQEYKQSIRRWIENLKKDNPNSIELQTIKMLDHIFTLQSQHLNNPRIINSEAFDALHRLKTLLLYEIAPIILKKYRGYEAIFDEGEFLREVWQNRNKIMLENIIRTAKQYIGKRLVVVTGHWHRYILRDLLKDEPCIDLKEYWEVIGSSPTGVANAEQSAGSLTTLDGSKKGNIKDIAMSVAGGEGSTGDRAKKLVKWMNENFEWTSTDYKQRTVEEIIQRRGGNCAEQAKVLMALLKAAGIQARWVQEINIHPKSKRREEDAKKLIVKHGNKFSVFGYMHNDHRWLEICDDAIDMWIPADPSLGIFGEKDWIKVRLGFGERPKATKDMIVPFVVIIRQKGHLVEDRSEHYLVNEFNMYYDNKLNKLSAWPRWVSTVRELSKLGSAAFNGEINLHEHTNLMIQLEQAYLELKKEFMGIGSG